MEDTSWLREQLADPGLALCPDGRKCPLYHGDAPRHAVSLHERRLNESEVDEAYRWADKAMATLFRKPQADE